MCGSLRLGTSAGLETRLVPERGYHLELITPVPLPRKLSGDLMRLPLRVRRAVRQTRAVLDDVDADVVIGSAAMSRCLPTWPARGGLSGVVACPWWFTRPNASAGWANRVGAALGRTRAVGGPGSWAAARRGRRGPVRAAITSLDRMALRAEARAHFGSPTTPKVLLVFGGSQGAQRINQASRVPPKTLRSAVFRCCMRTGRRTPSIFASPPTVIRRTSRCRIWNRMDLAYAARIWRSAGRVR
jgi:UDP-N-acetylglucosamine--N-acetylmuramyl-(pentapeptide) pyrophosphoryl-undecaprenol N-acetylglucosamine transferase